MLERRLRRFPGPHLARLAAALEGPRRQRSALADRVEHVTLRLAVLALPAPPVCVREVHHAPLEERVVLDGQQACLVRPVLEDPALAEQPRDRAARVEAEPRRQRQPVRAVDRRDRVELHGRESTDLGGDVRPSRRPRPCRVAVVRDDVAPELVDGDGLHGRSGRDRDVARLRRDAREPRFDRRSSASRSKPPSSATCVYA